MAKLVLQHGRKVMDLLIYILLVGVSYVLIKGIYDIFMLGKLDYHYTKHPVTVSDNPAVLVKIWKIHDDIEIKFGVNYTIEVFDWDDESGKYVTNPNNVLIYHDRTTRESFPQLTSPDVGNKDNLIEVTRIATIFHNHVLIISPLKTSLNNKLKNFQLRFTNSTAIDFVGVTLTSAKNAYGATWNWFFDGNTPHWVRLTAGYNNIFRVNEVREFINPEYLGCSKESYYECLESSLANMDVCKEHGGLCEYVTLPQSILPLCKSGMSNNRTSFLQGGSRKIDIGAAGSK